MTDGEWSCESCIILHSPDVAERVMERLVLCDDLEEIWKEVEELL